MFPLSMLTSALPAPLMSHPHQRQLLNVLAHQTETHPTLDIVCGLVTRLPNYRRHRQPGRCRRRCRPPPRRRPPLQFRSAARSPVTQSAPSKRIEKILLSTYSAKK